MKLDHKELTKLVMQRKAAYLGDGGTAEQLAILTGSTLDTVRRWSVDQPAKGERLIKLWHLFAAAGIRSPELNRLQPLNRYGGELLTFGLVNMQDLLTIFGVKNPQDVFCILRGQKPVKPGYDLGELRELYDDKLQAAKQQLASDQPDAVATIPDPQPVKPETAPVATQPAAVSDMLITAAAAFSTTLAYARYFNSDDCSPEERSKLRALLGDGGMFELSNHLNALCSERSRNQGK